MPQVTVYIREEDMGAWRAVEKKSEFMHQVLSKVLSKAIQGVSPISDKQPTVVSPTNIKPTIKKPEVPFIPGLTTADKIQTNGLCKIHGQALDSRQRCMQKDCKYA
jgi:hypothetical protein